jgi:pyruvate dehydrogenase E2 component (dihydrolipoamide acetyltransferase)
LPKLGVLDFGGLRGPGPHGRIVKADIDAALAKGPAAKPAAAAPAAKASAAAPPAPIARSDFEPEFELEKLSSMRKTIARRLTESKQQVPHFYLTIDVDAEPLAAARASINAELADSGEKISLNDLLIKACAVALRRVPAVNASFLGDSVAYHDRVDISVAVAIPDGLVTPVVRNADQLGVLAIARTVKDLAARAKDKKLKPEEFQNGTFSISNLGMFGIDDFSAVINPPEGAILAVSAVRDEPVVKKGAVVPGKRLALTLSCDHRVIDGAVGAEWLKMLRGLLESPLRMIV